MAESSASAPKVFCFAKDTKFFGVTYQTPAKFQLHFGWSWMPHSVARKWHATWTEQGATGHFSVEQALRVAESEEQARVAINAHIEMQAWVYRRQLFGEWDVEDRDLRESWAEDDKALAFGTRASRLAAQEARRRFIQDLQAKRHGIRLEKRQAAAKDALQRLFSWRRSTAGRMPAHPTLPEEPETTLSMHEDSGVGQQSLEPMYSHQDASDATHGEAGGPQQDASAIDTSFNLRPAVIGQPETPQAQAQAPPAERPGKHGKRNRDLPIPERDHKARVRSSSSSTGVTEIIDLFDEDDSMAL